MYFRQGHNRTMGAEANLAIKKRKAVNRRKNKGKLANGGWLLVII